jgi:hypothetical protein
MLGGMAAARKGVKIDRTRNTIRKIHEIVMPQYESYVRRRVPAAVNGVTIFSGNDARAIASRRLVWLRKLMMFEMPDSWGDVGNATVDLRTGPVLAYAATKVSLSATPANGSAECLYMIASRGSGEPDAMERFRTEEVGDTDADGAPEFLDAWGRPIEFIRWATGFNSPLSPVQSGDPTSNPDPLDPMRTDPNGYALVPLIISLGPDGGLGLEPAPSNGWSAVPPPQGPQSALQSIIAVSPKPGSWISGIASDNITNHDLSKK